MICTSIMRTLMDFLQCYAQFSTIMKSTTKFVIDMINYISNWTSNHTIQRGIVLIISNWHRTLRLSDFEITRMITP